MFRILLMFLYCGRDWSDTLIILKWRCTCEALSPLKLLYGRIGGYLESTTLQIRICNFADTKVLFICVCSFNSVRPSEDIVEYVTELLPSCLQYTVLFRSL